MSRFQLTKQRTARRASGALCAAFVAAAALADDTIINSKHDLSAFGPGPVRAIAETQVCIFCHTPHNASPDAPLWNRHNPTTYYRIYRSRSMDARVDQPGPASKLCLSCHDGSLALGLTLDRPLTDPILMTHTHMPTGPSNLTTDLSDDHPIGFRYDRALSNRDPQLRPPQLVDHRIPLGERGELECIACHDPHNNELGDFLRITDREGALCLTCHDMKGWRFSSHALSPRRVPLSATNGQQLPYASLADNACQSCHLPHTAPYREQLLYDAPSRLCLDCHDGVNASNVLEVTDKQYGHRINPLLPPRDNPDRRSRLERYVQCTDCHNPHAVSKEVLRGRLAIGQQGPLVPPAMREVPGETLGGLPIESARFYYEVCFRCHGDRPVLAPQRIIREQDELGNIRRQFLPTTASAHPVTFPARLTPGEVPSLLPEYRNRRFISCQSCHNNPDSIDEGGLEVNGPHTSRYEYLLVAQYETDDFTLESPQSYALCYRCHDRTSILGDESFSLHNVHIVRGRTPCSACHAPHGVNGSPAQHDHLINFDLSIVQGEHLFVDTGDRTGSCTLTCHGVRHVNFTYGPR